MRILEWARIAFKSIGANKLRSALTMLGIIIGVGAVIGLMSVGEGATGAVTARLESMGSHVITIRAQRALGGELTVADAVELVERVPTIDSAIPSVSFSTTAKYMTTTHDTSVEGTTEPFVDVRSIKPSAGRFITGLDVDNRSRVAVLGQTVATELFRRSDPLGSTIYLSGQPFTVVGIMESKGTTMGRDSDDIIYIPVTTAQRLTGTTRVALIYARARSAEDAAQATRHITAIYSARFARPDAVRVSSQDELLSAVTETAQTFTLLLGAIAGISLLVGGIGIMNIMLVSVTERTREIGIRKSIGAKRWDIMGQFLVESTLLSITGGAAGVACGLAMSRFIARFGGWDTWFSLRTVGLAFGFAAAVGLFFGVYPAWRAASLGPIEALRHE